MTECKSTTHYTGCACHEARREEEIARLYASLDAIYGLLCEPWADEDVLDALKICEEALNGGKKG